MRILLVTHGLPAKDPGGVQYYTLYLARQLAKNHEVYIFVRDRNPGLSEYEVGEYQLGEIKVISVIKNTGYPKNFKDSYIDKRIDSIYQELIEKIKPDVVHIQHVIFLSAGIFSITKKNNIPIVVTLHDFWYICPAIRMLTPNGKICPCLERDDYGFFCYHEHFSKFFLTHSIFSSLPKPLKRIFPIWIKNLVKKIFNKIFKLEYNNPVTNEDKLLSKERRKYMLESLLSADFIVSPSFAVKKVYKKFSPTFDRIEVVPHGIEIQDHDKSKKLAGNGIRFCYLGTFYEHKGIDLLIRAFQLLNSTQSSLDIYGDFRQNPLYYSKMKKLVGRQKNIHFRGAYKNIELEKIFLTSDVVVLPTRCIESFNMVIRESFAFQMPVIASNIGAIPEIVEDEVNGLLFESGNFEQLAKKMKLVIERPMVLMKFKEGIPKVKSMKKNANELVEIYKKVTSN